MAMSAEGIEEILRAGEEALDSGGTLDLAELGFWRAVAAVKRQPALIDRFADRIGRIDQRAFERGVAVTLPMPAGTALMAAATGAGLAMIGAAPSLRPSWRGPALLVGTGILLGATHDLAHLIVGKAIGLRFTRWFISGPTRPQPGLKTDYGSYLRVPPASRAWMHASGAIVTKVVPFAVLPVAAAARAPAWALLALGAIGVGQILTDALVSVRHSDWKRFRREMRVARERERATGHSHS